jgi:glycosyltransferase involved in cell wall biosynthesis
LTRVLFLSESFHPVLGGGEQHILRLSRRLVEAGDAATVVTRQTEAAWPRLEELHGVRVVRVPPAGPARLGKYAMLPAAFAAIAHEAFDVLVVRGTRVLALPGLAAGRLRTRPVVFQPEVNGELSGEVYSFGVVAQGSRTERLLRGAVLLRNLWMRDADAFVAMSKAIESEFLAHGVPAARIARIPHGVDSARFRPPSAEERQRFRGALAIPSERIVATYTGRLLRGKGLQTLLDAFELARGQGADLHLLFVGSGRGQALSVEDALRSRAAASTEASRIAFLDHVEKVEESLFASVVFVLPSVFEALGLSLVEAAACGLACIGSNTGGIPDVIQDGRTGLLFAPGEAGELAAHLVRLAADPGQRAELGRGARVHVLQRFDEADAVASYRSLFAELRLRRRSAAA